MYINYRAHNSLLFKLLLVCHYILMELAMLCLIFINNMFPWLPSTTHSKVLADKHSWPMYPYKIQNSKLINIYNHQSSIIYSTITTYLAAYFFDCPQTAWVSHLFSRARKYTTPANIIYHTQANCPLTVHGPLWEGRVAHAWKS
jgi:hypothetical protein